MPFPHFYTAFKSPIGEIVLTSNGEGITGLFFPEHADFEKAKKGDHKPNYFIESIKQLQEYFEGTRQKFNLPLIVVGTPFQKRVWEALNDINYGTTKNYGEIAKDLNNPNASRAVGMAISKNLLGIIVPCHRVIGANGKLTGFAGGLSAKKWLLAHEKSVPS